MTSSLLLSPPSSPPPSRAAFCSVPPTICNLLKFRPVTPSFVDHGPKYLASEFLCQLMQEKWSKQGNMWGGSDMISFWEKHKPFTCKQATHGQRLKSTKVVLKSITCALIKQKRKGIMDQLHAGAFKCSVTRPAFKLSG